jgi:hypothetical protein
VGFLSKVHALIAPSAAGVAVKSEGKAYDDARGPMFGSLATMRPPGVSSGGRGNAGNNGYTIGQDNYATQSDLSPSGVGGQTYLPWVGALTAMSGAPGPVMERRQDGGPGLQGPGQPWEFAPDWTHQVPGGYTNILGGDASGWNDINNGPAPARVPHQFRPALRMNATLHSHGQGEQGGTLSGINSTHAFRPPANLLGGNSVSRFPRSVRLPSGTGATTNGAGTSFVPAVFVPRGVQ